MRVIRAIPTQVIPLGRLGENECTQILFDISGWLEEYPSAAIGLYNLRPGDTESYPVGALTTSDGSAVWTVKNSDLSAVGKGRCELVAIEDNVIVKSAIYTTQVAEALDGSGEIPEPWEDWKEEFVEIKDDVEAAASSAQDASEAIQNMGVEAGTLPPSSPATVTKNVDPETGEVTLSFGIPQGVKGDKGDKGDRGYSPTATVTKSGKTATISLTDIDGTTTATITDGNDGFTPTANVVQNVDGAKITITDVNGTTFATVYDGEDGYSPSAVVLKKDYGARISITDKDGTTFADVYNGETGNGIVSAVLNNNYTLTLTFSDGSYTTVGPIRGEKGVGIASITKTGTSGLVDTYTITFDDGSTTTFTVTNGESVQFHICTSSEYDEITRVPTVQNPSTKTFYLVPAEDGSSPDLFIEWIWTGTAWEMFGSTTIEVPVEDVQVNNTSIVDANGIANIQKASSNNLGVVGIEPQSGVVIASNGKLEINPASTADIKKGENTNKPIVVFKQDAATFYGLATAAGDTTQSQSSNPVGTYTDEAKTAIKSMIGVEDGFSPSASVTQTATGATISITDKQGTTTANIENGTDGTDGEDGYSPSVTVTDIAGGHRVTVTDAGGAHSFDVMDGTGSVQDVQVNGVSVLDAQGVANVVVSSDRGLYFDTTNGLGTSPAVDAEIKVAAQQFKPITPLKQHRAAFYGLAKAAGDTTQSASSNAVGNYTENAKKAIRTMIGAADGSDYRLIYSIDATDSSTIEVSTDLNGDPISLHSVFVLATCPASQAANSGIAVSAYDGSTQKGVGYINTAQNTTEVKRGYCIIDASHGLWKTEQASFGTSGLITLQTYVRFTDVLGGSITKVRLTGVIAGYTVKIYGY